MFDQVVHAYLLGFGVCYWVFFCLFVQYSPSEIGIKLFRLQCSLFVW